MLIQLRAGATATRLRDWRGNTTTERRCLRRRRCCCCCSIVSQESGIRQTAALLLLPLPVWYPIVTRATNNTDALYIQTICGQSNVAVTHLSPPGRRPLHSFVSSAAASAPPYGNKAGKQQDNKDAARQRRMSNCPPRIAVANDNIPGHEEREVDSGLETESRPCLAKEGVRATTTNI